MSYFQEDPAPKDKKTISVLQAARIYLALTAGSVGLTLISELRLPKNMNHIPPITSNYFLPNFLMICNYLFSLFFFFAIITWLIKGDKS